MQRDQYSYNYHTFKTKMYLSLIRVLKSRKKKLTITSLFFLGQETWLDDSWKFIHINQSKFYNYFHEGKFKNI